MYLTTLATLVVILVASFQAGSAPGATLPYHIPLDPNGNLQLSWNISYTQQELYLKLRVSHLQYGVVLGMSDRGEIFNADLVVLWSDGKRSYFGVSAESTSICLTQNTTNGHIEDLSTPSITKAYFSNLQVSNTYSEKKSRQTL